MTTMVLVHVPRTASWDAKVEAIDTNANGESRVVFTSEITPGNIGTFYSSDSCTIRISEIAHLVKETNRSGAESGRPPPRDDKVITLEEHHDDPNRSTCG